MTIHKRLRNWGPQPKSQIRTNYAKISAPLFAIVLLAEIILLLVAPLVYNTFLAPNTIIVRGQEDQTLPLTSEQINAAWPNLPTAQEIVSSGKGDYSSVDTRWGAVDFSQIYNHTWLSPVNAEPHNYPSRGFVTILVPVENFIWLQLNDTTWISPGNSWLATDHPPYSLPAPDSFSVKTELPTEYFIILAATISATLTTGISYFIIHRKRLQQRNTNERQ